MQHLTFRLMVKGNKIAAVASLFLTCMSHQSRGTTRKTSLQTKNENLV